MASQTAPVVPARPSRSPQPATLAPEGAEMPKIPPRPTRRVERSVSPMRGSYAPSPLNEIPSANHQRKLSTELAPPQRPPSVTLPSLGQEGMEYADLDYQTSQAEETSPAQTRNVDSELKLHAPRPSLPTSSAKAQVQAVTRTDSQQAAAAGIGKSRTPSQGHEDSERFGRSPYPRTSHSRYSSTASADRRTSLHLDDEHGIPEIGKQVPMYPDAGDVQAPSPAPALGLNNNGLQRPGRNHQRTRSGRDVSLPPGSYGLHGHGVQSADKFEKAWYDKHPDEQARVEKGQYGPGLGSHRAEWALSSDDLNKIVRTSAAKGSGLGTSPAVMGTPEEQVGYIASEEYISRLASPSHVDSQRGVSSNLREFELADSSKSESTDEPADVIHVDEPYHHQHHPDGFASAPEDHKSYHRLSVADDDGEIGDEAPILAEDEIEPDAQYLQPAISPAFERPGSGYISADFDHRSRTPSVGGSRPSSRPASIGGAPAGLARWNSRGEEREESNTPLDDVEEYEPLFPEEEGRQTKPISAAERFKQRPEMSRHRFPSQDIWEDTPNSLQLHATVSTPEIAGGGEGAAQPKRSTFETPEQEEARRRGIENTTTNEETKPEKPSRPLSARQRFPSSDIWEDAPDSHQLVTTVDTPEPNENDAKSPPGITAPKPVIPVRPAKRADNGTAQDASGTSPTEGKKAPGIPDRPKPQVPTRPAKPAVPARPVGSKIAALKAGFLSDLDKRLQLGPQAPKPQEKEEPEAPVEKAPLSDARKGRARGPARRKPAGAEVKSVLPSIPEITITATWNVWQIGEDGQMVVGRDETSQQPEAVSIPEPTPAAPPLAKNTAGEDADPTPVSEPAHAQVEQTHTDTEPTVAEKAVAPDAVSSSSAAEVTPTTSTSSEVLEVPPETDGGSESCTTKELDSSRGIADV